MKNRRKKLLYQHAMNDADRRYHPEIGLVSSGSMGEAEGTCFRPAGSLGYALALLAEGYPESVERARTIISAVLDSQELNPDRPHYGNFVWLAGDSEVGDLNAVQFVMRGLLPILIRHEQKLPNTLIDRCKKALKLALNEEVLLDVSYQYTNIHLMSLFALLTGGQWLDDEHFRKIGRERWERFIQLTAAGGAPYEYNSFNYCSVDLSVLAALISLTDEDDIRLQAKLLYERFWLHVGLHIHYPTHQLAGPHCRAYWKPMNSGYGLLGDLIWSLTCWDEFIHTTDDGTAEMESLYALELLQTEHNPPDYLFPWIRNQKAYMPYEVVESVHSQRDDDIITYVSPSFSLGTAARTYGIGTDCFYIEHQANYMALHYTKPDNTWNMVYSRFVINDRHWNTISAASDRPTNANFYEQGNYGGVQAAGKSINLYSLLPQQEEVFSIKTAIVFPAGQDITRILVNDNDVDWNDLPRSIEPDEWIVVEDGNTYIGIYPLDYSHLGPGTGIQLEQGPCSELWLTVSNYRGTPKRFWEYASLKGVFWKGNIKAGYILDAAETADYPCAEDFSKALRQAVIEDTMSERHVRSVRYYRDGTDISLDYDLMDSDVLERRRNGEKISPAGLLSPLAVHGSSGYLELDGAAVSANKQPIILISHTGIADFESRIGINLTDAPTPLRFSTPQGVLTAENWGMGRIEWKTFTSGKQTIEIQGLTEPENISAPDDVRVTFQKRSR